MANVDTPQPGHFCWIELATSDADRAKQFYTSLFDWTTVEHDMGEMGKYYIFQKNGRDAAAMYKMMAEQSAGGMPPNWTTYVGVESADESAKKAASLGATIFKEPFDVYDMGRMAVIQDPQGAVFAIWEAKANNGVAIRDEENTLCWNELASNDPVGSRDFYTKLVGWSINENPDYSEWQRGGRSIGGLRRIGEGDPTPPSWLPYFMTADCDAVAKKIESLGGHVIVPPTNIPTSGRFAVASDPQGAFFAVYQES